MQQATAKFVASGQQRGHTHWYWRCVVIIAIFLKLCIKNRQTNRTLHFLVATQTMYKTQVMKEMVSYIFWVQDGIFL